MKGLGLLVVAAAAVASANAEACTTFLWPSVEDVTYYRNGLVLGTSGLGLYDSAPGRLFGMDLSLGKLPTESVELKMLGVPADLGMQPHGMFLDPVGDHLYIVSHNDTRREETIVVFGVEHVTNNDGSTGFPNLRFKYALKDLVNANEKVFTSKEQVWHFNDVAAVDGKNELYVTQLGPLYMLNVPKYVWRCTWTEKAIGTDGRLNMNCAHAHPRASAGYNGITISSDSTKLWANDIFGQSIVEFDRKPDGSLTHVRTVNMPRLMDNIEYDRTTGDIALSSIGDFGVDPAYLTGYAGALIWRCKDKGKHLYKDSVEVYQQDGAPYQIASATVVDGLLMLGSPVQAGPKVCKINQMKKLSLKITEGASAKTSCLMITAVAKTPMGVELQALCDIDDLSLYHIGMATGIPSLQLYGATLTFGFPAGSKMKKGDYVTVANNAKAFEAAYGIAPTFTSEIFTGLVSGPVGLAMAGQLVDSYGNPDGSDAEKWGAVAKWVSRDKKAVPGGKVFTSAEWTDSCCMQSLPYKAGSVQEAWDNHFQAFANQNLDQIMLDYTEDSELVYYQDPEGGYAVFKGLKSIRKFFADLFGQLTDLSEIIAPVIEVTDTPNAKQVFLVWACPSSNLQSATDTFLFDKNNKIARQNIHGTVGTKKISYQTKTDLSTPPAKMPVKVDSSYAAPSVQSAWDNHFAAFGGQNIVNMMKDYTEKSVLKAFDHRTGGLTTAVGRAQIQTFFQNLFLQISDTRGLGIGALDVTNQVFLVWECPTSGIVSATDTFIFDVANKISRQNIVYTSGELIYEYTHVAASCPGGFWASGCGQPASEQTGGVVCMGKGNRNSWKYDDSKCTGKKPMPMTKACPATAPCPRCKGCKRNGDCWKVCGKKAGLCAACNSADGTPGACCLSGDKADSIECRISEPQFFAAVKEKHTCALLPGDAHVAGLIKSVIQRLDKLEGAVEDLD